MLQKMRDGAQTLGAKVMVAIIAFVLTVFGFGAFNLFAVGEPVAATVNGDEITEAFLTNETERRMQFLRAELGEDMDPSLIDREQVRESTLQTLINRTLLLQLADDLDLAVSRKALDREITSMQEFQVDGVFDEGRFRSVLASAGFSPASFLDDQARNVRLDQLTGAVSDTVVVTEKGLREASRVLGQQRDIAYLEFPPDAFAAGIEVSDDEVARYYEDNVYLYLTEENVDLEYVELSMETLMADQEVDEADLVAAFEEEERIRIESDAGEERRAAHILLQVTDARSEEDAIARLLEIRAEIETGSAFSDKARELSEDAGSAANDGDLGFVGRGTFVPAFEEALWELAVGELSGPVKTEFGVHLITLLEVRQAEPRILEDERERLMESIRRDRAQPVFEENLRTMDEIAFEQPDTLDGIVESLGLTIRNVQGVTREAAEGVFADRALRDAAFEPDVLVEGYNSPAVTIDDRGAVVVRVTAHHPAMELPLEEVAESIRENLVAQRAAEAASAAADAALGRLLAGEAASDVAGEHALTWQNMEATGYLDPGTPGPVRAAAFRLSPPAGEARSASTTRLADGGSAVVVVSRVEPGDYGALSEAERARLRGDLVQLASQRAIGSVVVSLREEAGL
ncbi:MAG: SurA N-terminal domain-containing protein [Gammaproteobacteria bacterium]|nr:SurA N-terminal domain-containing protein [Gammaproteobacteria bacterium]